MISTDTGDSFRLNIGQVEEVTVIPIRLGKDEEIGLVGPVEGIAIVPLVVKDGEDPAEVLAKFLAKKTGCAVIASKLND